MSGTIIHLSCLMTCGFFHFCYSIEQQPWWLDRFLLYYFQRETEISHSSKWILWATVSVNVENTFVWSQKHFYALSNILETGSKSYLRCVNASQLMLLCVPACLCDVFRRSLPEYRTFCVSICLIHGPCTAQSTLPSEEDPNMADLYTRLYNSSLKWARGSALAFLLPRLDYSSHVLKVIILPVHTISFNCLFQENSQILIMKVGEKHKPSINTTHPHAHKNTNTHGHTLTRSVKNISR